MSLTIAGRTFRSRLVVGTGKYPSHAVMQAAHVASGTDMVTVAVRRVDLAARGEGSLLHWIDRSQIFLLPNTAGCYTADDAIRTARLAQEAGLSNWVKLEVLGDERTLALLHMAARTLAARERQMRECADQALATLAHHVRVVAAHAAHRREVLTRMLRDELRLLEVVAHGAHRAALALEHAGIRRAVRGMAGETHAATGRRVRRACGELRGEILVA